MELPRSASGAPALISLFYPPALRGMEALIPRMRQQGTAEIIVTNWTKGSPHENTHYGLAYGADLCWSTAGRREDFQRRYARLAFGSRDSAICSVYEMLSLPLPYAEPVSHHQAEKLNRYDLSGFRFPAKWKRYTNPENEPRVLEQLRHGLSAGKAASAVLSRLAPGCKSGERQIELLSLSASCIQAKARLALALHEGHKLDGGRALAGTGLKPRSLLQTQDRKAIQQWLAEAPSISAAWQKAKEQHRRALERSGFRPVIAFLNDLLFELEELVFFTKMSEGLSAL